jgi:hypothetical protein
VVDIQNELSIIEINLFIDYEFMHKSVTGYGLVTVADQKINNIYLSLIFKLT